MLKKEYNDISKEEFIKRFLDILNLIQPENKRLINSERDLFVEFLLLSDEYKYYRYASKGKKEVERVYKRKYGKVINQSNITTKLRALIKKSYITEDSDRVKYTNKNIEALLNKKQLNINFILSTNE